MILHIVKEEEWEKAKVEGIYKSQTLESEGFIHCSPIEKVIDVANYNFKGVKGLVLLCIDEEKVKSEIKWEDLYSEGREYPHIYDELNIDAVNKEYDFPAKKEGYFELPKELKYNK
ncbi:DUF952 domain-containing protein [Clostridium sp. D2Q-11]|uniref:DUF952 domain-containing protein n=1 Tax=Anaeromonas frigoriresistens TaxID=2683708 RepID=A0A942UR30_9FIRM|nr:DUF952 domain-containing protein [Anaeromonas frigoriresistens]MBS4537648.1 DUF952 domain-containing protein [Anaeromonas frigoriresistens]